MLVQQTDFEIDSPHTTAGTALFLVAVAAYFAWAIREKFNRHVRILLKTKKEVPGFFKRNKDQLILMLLSAAVGGLITKLLGL